GDLEIGARNSFCKKEALPSGAKPVFEELGVRRFKVEEIAEFGGQGQVPETATTSVEPAPEPSKLQFLDAYEGRYPAKVHPLYELVIHGLLNGKDTQAQEV